MALSVSIFSLYSLKQKQKKFADFIKFFCAFSKFYKNKNLLNNIFWNFDHSLTFPEVTWGPTKNLGPIDSTVLTFIGYNPSNKQTDRQAKYIYRCFLNPKLLKPLVLAFSKCVFRNFVLSKLKSFISNRSKVLSLAGQLKMRNLT